MPHQRDAPQPAPDGGLPAALLQCPRCARPLARDSLWASPHWLCPAHHGYSNVRVLLTELRERGWLPE